jgi:hypothetical protein
MKNDFEIRSELHSHVHRCCDLGSERGVISSVARHARHCATPTAVADSMRPTGPGVLHVRALPGLRVPRHQDRISGTTTR